MSTITPPTEQQVQDVVAPYLASNVGFAIGVASPQFTPSTGIFFFEGNLLNYKQQSMALDHGTYFEIASNTKIFTAALLTYYSLNDSNLLDANVVDYRPPGKPTLPSSLGGITLLELANYTSGLPQDNSDPNDQPKVMPQPYNALSMYSFLHDDNVTVSGTGTTYAYSNLGFSLLAWTIPAAVEPEASFRELLREIITAPLEMNNSRVFADVPVTKLPLGINSGQKVRSGWAEFPAYFGAGGIVSTPHDMMTWLKFNMGMLSESSLNGILEPMQTPSTTVKTGFGEQLGIGWFITSIPAECQGELTSLPVIWKDGGLGGFSSFVTFLQSDTPGSSPSEAGVFVLTNSSCPEVGHIAFQILRIMNGCSGSPSHIFSINHRARSSMRER